MKDVERDKLQESIIRYFIYFWLHGRDCPIDLLSLRSDFLDIDSQMLCVLL